MSQVLAFLAGKKTYLVAGLTLVGAVLTMIGYHIPDWVWPVLGAAGLGAVRSAIVALQPALPVPAVPAPAPAPAPAPDVKS